MLYSILFVLLVIGLIFGFFQWLGWIVGVFNKHLNSNQRTTAGVFITIFFVFKTLLIGYEWSNGAERLDELRANEFRKNNPGYYDINSLNLGNERPESSELIQAKDAIQVYDDRMANKILLWIGGYILLVIIGFIGESIYPLKE